MQKSNNNFKLNRNILLNPRYYRLFALATFAFLLAFVTSAILAPVSPSSAQEVTIKNNATGYYLTITTADVVSLSVDSVPSGTLATALQTVNVKTNSLSGYQLSLSADTTNNLYKDGDSGNASAGYFKPITGSVSTPSSLALDTWGFALDSSTSGTNTYAANFADVSYYNPSSPSSSATFAPVPVSTSSEQILQQVDTKTPETGNNLDVYYGVNATTRLPSGTYSTTLTYTAISDAVSPVTATMQDFTSEQCEAIPEDTYTILKDTRDNKDYLVSHLKDGNCWMTQNLALAPADGETDLVLTPSDSNVTAPRTIPGSSLIDGNSTTPSEYDTPQIIATFQNTTDTYGSFYGNYYNWNAATATVGLKSTTGTVYESICPKGWRLPDNGSYNETDATGNKIKSYSNLVGNYTVNVDGTGDQMPTTDKQGANDAAIKRIQQTPLYFPLAGRYDSNDTASVQGIGGYYWSRTVSSGDDAYYLYFRTSNSLFLPQNNDRKYSAKTVRCVFGENPANTMQNFTTTMCNNLSISTSTADNRKPLMDTRDGKLYNISRLADNPTTENNGTCWMVSNLALDPVDGTGENRTLTTSDTNIDTTEIPTGEYTFPDNTLIASGTTSVATKEQIYNINATKTTTSCSNNTYCDSDNAEPYGNYHNWIAATLGKGVLGSLTNNVKSSVCPKNWRLPDSGTSSAYGASAPDKSYGKLMYAVLGFASENATGTTSGAYVKAAQQPPLFLPLSGRYYPSHPSGQGTDGTYWSRTAQGNGNAYNLYIDIGNNSGSFYPQFRYNRQYAFPVRCVLGE